MKGWELVGALAIIFAYEAFGVCILVLSINLSPRDFPIGIAFTLFTGMLLCGPVSGGHLNPAVSVAVYIQMSMWLQNLRWRVVMVIGQFAGGLLGIASTIGALGYDL